MTFEQAHERLDVLLDKHDLGWHEPEEKDIFLNFAQNEFIKNRAEEYEKNERNREDIRTLIASVSGVGASVPAPGDFMFLLRMKGTFSIDNCGVLTNQTRRISPIQLDDVDTAEEDPFNKPINGDPRYETTSVGFTILSDSAPLNWTITYIKLASSVNGTTFPGNTFDTPEHTHEEIVTLAADMMLKSIEKGNIQYQINEIPK